MCMWLWAHGREIGSWLPLLGLLASLDYKAASILWDFSPQPLFRKGLECPDSAVSIVYRLSDLKERGVFHGHICLSVPTTLNVN